MALITASAQSDALTLPRNLGELVGESQIVLQGTVTGVLLEQHLTVIIYTPQFQASINSA
jgi:hypothetical protein